MAFNTAPQTSPSPWSLDEADDQAKVSASNSVTPSVGHGRSRNGEPIGSRQSVWGDADRSRYSDRPMPLTTRLFGLSGTALVGALILTAALVKWHTTVSTQPPATLSVFDVAAPQAPPAPQTEIPPGPEQVQKEERPPVEMPNMPPPLVQVPSVSATSVPVAEPVSDPGPKIEKTSAPESKPLRPGSTVSDAKPTWEGQVLAALNKAKRYPREAKRNRQQGTPWVRFVMDREGRVRTVQLERSSGFDELDREALALPGRASPLPKPPESVTGERVELVVPMEFFLK